MIDPRVGEAHQPWFATPFGDGNSDIKPMVRRTCWHCLILLCQSNIILCYFLCRGTKFGSSQCDVRASQSKFSTTFLKIVVEVMTSGQLQVGNLWLWVSMGMIRWS